MYDSINNEETFKELRQLAIIFCKRSILPENQIEQMLQVAAENNLQRAAAYFKEVLRLQNEDHNSCNKTHCKICMPPLKD